MLKDGVLKLVIDVKTGIEYLVVSWLIFWGILGNFGEF
jgi:hypothetical protein